MKKRFAAITELIVGRKTITIKISKQGIVEIKKQEKKKEDNLEKWLR